MFPKAITLLAFVTCALAQFGSGVYEIRNVGFQNIPVRGSSDGITNLRVPDPQSPANPADLVSPRHRQHSGVNIMFQWEITSDPEGSLYTIEKFDEETNPLIYAGVAVSLSCITPLLIAYMIILQAPEPGQFVDSFRSPTTLFAIVRAGPGQYEVRLASFLQCEYAQMLVSITLRSRSRMKTWSGLLRSSMKL
jgi:hypothetical protein